MVNTSTYTNIVGKHYGIGKQIGEGSFGIVFEGINLLNHQQVAIKFELHKSKAAQLRNEYRMYKALIGGEEFTKYLSYVRSLGFEDAPDYDYLRGLLTKALRNAGKLEDNTYD
ncbi:unnamed protein product [Alternaria alternata]